MIGNGVRGKIRISVNQKVFIKISEMPSVKTLDAQEVE